MKYLLLIIFFVGCSCESRVDQETSTQRVNSDIDIIEIDNCEYIFFDGCKAGGMTYKGNCKNHGAANERF